MIFFPKDIPYDGIRPVSQQGGTSHMASGKGKWHVKRGFQSKVSHGACHGSQDGTIGGWWCYCCHKTYIILWQLSNLSLGGIKLMTLGEMWSKLVPKTEDTYKEEYLKNSTTESIFIVLRWCCIIQTFVFSKILYKCCVDWLIVCKKQSCAREKAHVALHPPARARMIALSTEASRCFKTPLSHTSKSLLSYIACYMIWLIITAEANAPLKSGKLKNG